MSAIAGFTTKNPDQRSAALRLSKMLQVMRRDPSCAEGRLCLPDQGTYVGWIGPPGSCGYPDPVVSRSGELTLIFCGEHFAAGGPQAAAEIVRGFEAHGD